MALVVADRVKETTTSVGTSTINLAGAEDNFESFVTGVGSGNTTYYAIVDKGNSEFEVGLGTVTSGTPDTLSRDTVLASSNSDALVNFASGSKDVFCTQPAEKAVYLDSSGQLVIDGTAVTATAAELNYVDGVTSNIQTQLDSKLNLSGGTMTGALTLSGAPTADNHATTKIYVDELIAAGIHYHDPVRVESPDSAGSLTATYNNGASGVGATLTNNGTQAALVIDDVTLNTNDRVLIYNQTNAFENGIYTVTNTGSASTNWVLTRATDADSYGIDNQSLSEGTSVFVLEGTDGSGEVYACTTTGTITFGTTAINFSQIGKSAVITGNGGITVTGNQVGANVDATVQTTAANSVTSTSSRTYAVQVDSGNDLVVNVPWVDTDTNTDTTYTAGTGLTLSGTQFSVTDNYVLNTGDAIAGQLSITDSVWPPLSVTRDAGAVTTGNYGALKLNTSTTGTPAAGLGSYAAFYVDDVIKGAVGFENDGSFHVTDGGSTERLVIDGSGNLGIGTTSPIRTLHVDSSSNLVGRFSSSATEGFIQLAGSGTGTAPRVGATGNNFIVYTNDAERMRIGSGGYVGIGVTDPDSALEVQSSASGVNSVHLSNTNSGGYGAKFVGGGTTATQYVADFRDYSGSSKLRIDGLGNVGIGVAPSEKLEVYGTTPRFQINDRGLYQAQLALIGNDLEIRGSSGQIEFYQGNADGASSTNQSMTLDASGNLLIGQTVGNVYNQSSVTGLKLDGANGNIQTARANNVSLLLNRYGTDGDIAQFYKDGAVVGSIYTNAADGGASSELCFASGNTGLKFDDTNNYIRPTNSAGAHRDNIVDLGTTNSRFKNLYLSGNITVGGTVDGRDVATDGTKLDGIEAGATADQTASEILTLIKTVDGAGSGLDADTLDGISSASFLRSDANDSHAGTLTLDVVQVGNELRLPNNTSLTDVTLTATSDQDTGFNWSGSNAVNYVSGGVLKYNLNNVWHSGNDGSGSGLDADTVDGIQGASFLRSDADDTATGIITLSKDTTDVLNFTANSTNDSRGISFNSRTALSADYNDGWMRLNQNSEFTNGTYSPKRISSAEQIVAGNSTVTSGGQLVCSNSTNPYFSFHEGGTRRAYIQFLTTNDELFIYNEQGDDIRFRANAGTAIFKFETTGATNTGRLWVDPDDFAMQHANGENIIYGRKDANTWVYYNGQWKIRTQANGIDIRNEASTYSEIRMTTGANADTRGYFYANTSNQVGILDTGGNWVVRATNDVDVDFFVNNTEKFSIGTSSTVSANDITINSDERIKDNIEQIPDALEKVQAIRGVTFNRTDTDDYTRHAGVIAQEVEKVLPEVVTENEETGIKSVAYANMVGLLIEAIKEQQTQIDDLKAEVTRLKGFE